METELDFSGQNLTKLPELPNSLQKLECQYNELQTLPELPNSLQELPYINKFFSSYSFSSNNIKYVNSKYFELNDNNKHLKYVLENIDFKNNPFYGSNEYNEIMNS